jgi:hypothetical protein
MTSLKLSYRRGVPAALLLGLIVGAPDIAQAVLPPGGIPPRGSSLPTPFNSIGPRSLPFRSAGPSSVINQTVRAPTRIPAAFPPSYAPTTRSIGTQTGPRGASGGDGGAGGEIEGPDGFEDGKAPAY